MWVKYYLIALLVVPIISALATAIHEITKKGSNDAFGGCAVGLILGFVGMLILGFILMIVMGLLGYN
jgi:hypothetical protein